MKQIRSTIIREGDGLSWKLIHGGGSRAYRMRKIEVNLPIQDAEKRAGETPAATSIRKTKPYRKIALEIRTWIIGEDTRQRHVYWRLRGECWMVYHDRKLSHNLAEL